MEGQIDPKILALAVPAIPFVLIAVDMLKIAAKGKTPPWVQVANAVLAGQIVVWLLLFYSEQAITGATAAGAALAGLYASSGAAGLAEIHQRARKA